MAKFITIEDALRTAVLTAQEQPCQVPEAPVGWLDRASAALVTADAERINAEAHEIVRAHSLYRAEPDVKGWLYELRIAMRDAH